MKIINTKRVGNTFVPDGDDLNPYSEYVHDDTDATPAETAITLDQVVVDEPYDREKLMANFNEFIEGVDVMSTMFTEILKRFR